MFWQRVTRDLQKTVWILLSYFGSVTYNLKVTREHQHVNDSTCVGDVDTCSGGMASGEHPQVSGQPGGACTDVPHRNLKCGPNQALLRDVE